MSEHDPSWEALTEAWKAPEAAPRLSDFESELKRRRRLKFVVVAGELGVTGVLVWASARLIVNGAAGENAVLLTGIWLFWAVAMVFAWWNRRGQWERTVASTDDFMRLSLERATRKIRVVWFTLALLVAQLAFVGVLVLTGQLGELRGSPAALALTVGGVASLYVLWAFWYYRRARAEASRFGGWLEEAESIRE